MKRIGDEAPKNEELVFLTLGDGDFTWSLDLGRFLVVASLNAAAKQHRLIATGIDTIDKLSHKYRNWSHIVRELKRLKGTSLSVEVLHGINACSPKPDLPRADVVIFNHPHLGKEDAALHSKFLCHLFYSVNTHWLLESGVFYLTLVKGQFERWECEQAALRHGMVLAERCTFNAAPVQDAFYEHRRHQTGKSFASRTGGSETLTFIRKTDSTTMRTMRLPKLPWFTASKTLTGEDACSVTNKEPTFICPFCSKRFCEERSVKSHINSKHADEQKKRKRLVDDDVHKDGSNNGPTGEIQFICKHCSEPRLFETPEALNDHVLAKHRAIHSTIPADRGKVCRIDTNVQVLGICRICGQNFLSEQDEKDHMLAFVPLTPETVNIKCSFCSKRFREKRAQLQHENFCPSRPA
jgi:uncharacterized Zn-finger protein